jgi:predicted ATP-dependent Lon-type protease
MWDWLDKRQKSNALRKEAESDAIASFLSEGKVKILEYSDKNQMKRIQKGWNRRISPSNTLQNEENEEYLIFSKEERLQSE